MLALIWAQDEKGLIGKNGQLPWHVPTDLAFFKEKTTGQTIVFGHTTFVGMGSRLLKNRQTIIMSRKKELVVPGATVMHSTAEVLELAKKQQVMIAGGSHVYKEFLPYADVLIKTEIKKTFEGDTYFPEVEWKDFKCVTIQPFTDEKTGIAGDFLTYHRIK